MSATLILPFDLDAAPAARSRSVRVRSADELRSALRQARASALSLDASGLDRVLRLDAARGLLEVQAAATWSLLAAYLAHRGIALGAFAEARCLPPTIGEAISQAAPGPDGLPVSAHVAAFTMVTPDGELRRASRDSNRELFRLALGGQGTIGVLYSVTLQLESLQRSARDARAPVNLCITDAAAAGTVECAIECLVLPAELGAYLADIRCVAHEHRVPLHGIAVRRYLTDHESFLRWATQEWAGVQVRFGVKLTLGAGVRSTEIRRLLLGLALARRGSFPIRDLRDVSREQLEACYPILSAFLAEKRRCDPTERLQNDWYRRLRTLLRGEPCEVRWAK